MNRIALLATLFGSIATAASQQPPPPPQQPPWTLTEDQIRAIVGRVRAGRDLTPKSWPNGARVAVGLSFDLDNETGTLRDGLASPALLSQGEYGSRAGLPRVLSLLERHGIAASFFVPAVTAMLHPESMKAIAKSGRHVVCLQLAAIAARRAVPADGCACVAFPLVPFPLSLEKEKARRLMQRRAF